jgi:hypothetical protein
MVWMELLALMEAMRRCCRSLLRAVETWAYTRAEIRVSMVRYRIRGQEPVFNNCSIAGSASVSATRYGRMRSPRCNLEKTVRT